MAFKALLFDLDGTLQDSEEQTDQAIEAVMARHGIAGVKLSPFETRGRSWQDVAHALLEKHPIKVSSAQLEAELLEDWRVLLEKDLRPIPGSPAALREARKYFQVAIVSSSPVRVINRFVEKFLLEDVIPPAMRIGADDVTMYKPHPEPWLLGAKRTSTEPQQCLVFEDSSAGLIAARAAGMHSVGLLHVSAEPEKLRSLADVAIQHYEALPSGFWQALAHGGLVELQKLRAPPM